MINDEGWGPFSIKHADGVIKPHKPPLPFKGCVNYHGDGTQCDKWDECYHCDKLKVGLMHSAITPVKRDYIKHDPEKCGWTDPKQFIDFCYKVHHHQTEALVSRSYRMLHCLHLFF